MISTEVSVNFLDEQNYKGQDSFHFVPIRCHFFSTEIKRPNYPSFIFWVLNRLYAFLFELVLVTVIVHQSTKILVPVLVFWLWPVVLHPNPLMQNLQDFVMFTYRHWDTTSAIHRYPLQLFGNTVSRFVWASGT